MDPVFFNLKFPCELLMASKSSDLGSPGLTGVDPLDGGALVLVFKLVGRNLKAIIGGGGGGAGAPAGSDV